MKTKTALLLTSTIALMSSNAFANTLNSNGMYTVVERNKTIHTESMTSKDAAYQQGLTILTQLQESSPKELKRELNVFTVGAASSQIQLKDGAYVTTQEFMNADGQVQYKGIVNVGYQYLERTGNS
ncbi:DUF3316 domain-containing protein [Vibrio sp. SCSIO 43135]|uniref:DUF3316 domain-containing protein n=1 Tax=Vibrio sp. SCSIO 43135 TaxID=2819096 RepID=UPI0020759BF9|nr:DUF3316 domain-containing protein [Vibrio sp. SCSIO 43135]USD43792.1 DUF3316 domain-containing protein [Vibrio sp. SCSIO 43135]